MSYPCYLSVDFRYSDPERQKALPRCRAKFKILQKSGGSPTLTRTRYNPLKSPLAYACLGMNFNATPLLHQRWPVGAGPSSNT